MAGCSFVTRPLNEDRMYSIVAGVISNAIIFLRNFGIANDNAPFIAAFIGSVTTSKPRRFAATSSHATLNECRRLSLFNNQIGPTAMHLSASETAVCNYWQTTTAENGGTTERCSLGVVGSGRISLLNRPRRAGQLKRRRRWSSLHRACSAIWRYSNKTVRRPY